jgi:hypothetical protein
MTTTIPTISICVECHRRFDLTDPVDSAEWTYGHDCEPSPLQPGATVPAADWNILPGRDVTVTMTAGTRYRGMLVDVAPSTVRLGTMDAAIILKRDKILKITLDGTS